MAAGDGPEVAVRFDATLLSRIACSTIRSQLPGVKVFVPGGATLAAASPIGALVQANETVY
jgi:hypothetical protein